MADTRKTAAWSGAISSLALTCILQADRLAKVFGIINIPKDARETMSALSSAPTFLSVGILVIGGACVVYLYLEHLKELKRRFWNPKLDLLTVGLLGLVVFAGITGLGLYRQSAPPVASPEPAKDEFVKNVSGPPIEWRFDKPVTILFYSRKPGQAVVVEAIQIHGTNKSDFALKKISALITADMKSGQMFTMRVNPHGTYIDPKESATVIPARASFDLLMQIGPNGGISAEDFLNQYGTLRFTFNYEQNDFPHSFSEQFSFSYLEDQIAFVELTTKDQRRSPPAQIKQEPPLGKKSDASPFDEFIPDVRVADSPAAVELFSAPARDKLIPLLEADKLQAWARPMGGGHPPLISVPINFWRTHMIIFLEKPRPNGVNQTFLKSKRDQVTAYYDVYLNQAQIKRVWPDFEAAVPKKRILMEANETKARLTDRRNIATAIKITNQGDEIESKCAVYLEDHGMANLPDPFALRTENQIRRSDSGRFSLSKGQPKIIPILLSNVAKNRFYIMDENGTSFAFKREALSARISFYGAPDPVRIRIDIKKDAEDFNLQIVGSGNEDIA